uniref:Uncharacterized protein n=1 Tax=Anguilla anguilla TaxID=7936 RepID=A0A0E9P7P2_ANGAN
MRLLQHSLDYQAHFTELPCL